MTHSKTDGTQLGLFPIVCAATIVVEQNHKMVILADTINWNELTNSIQKLRLSKLKSKAGRKPHLRQMIGALLVKGLRNLTYRETEDIIKNYVPARYLCELMDSDWTPDHTSIQDFAELIGQDGLKLINSYVIDEAVAFKFANSSAIAADTTAQEAYIPYPNEVGLMTTFISTIANAAKRVGHVFKAFGEKIKASLSEAKKLERTYRFFAKTKEEKLKITRKLMTVTGRILRFAKDALKGSQNRTKKIKGKAKQAHAKIIGLADTMEKLLPQIRSWCKDGKVVTGKIVSIHIPQLYSIVRGKIGKTVEFGLKWGITRLRGGYILATMAEHRTDLSETKYAVQTVQDHIEHFGKAPTSFAYDRGAFCQKTIAKLHELGVKNIAIAPKGKAACEVQGKLKKKLFSERAQVEGTIGVVKSRRYGFNRPRARSVAMMGTCGQLAVLCFNLNKLVRDIAQKRNIQLVGA